MKLRTPRNLGFLTIVILVLAIGCGDRRSVGCRGNQSGKKSSQLTELQSFCYKARLDGPLREGRITHGQLKEIHNVHKRWLHEKANRSRASNIGRDSEKIYEVLKDHRGKSDGPAFWRRDYKLVYCCRDLSGPDLRSLDLRWAYLPGARFNNADLTGSGIRAGAETFQHDIDLGQANLIGAEITRVKGKESLLRFALLLFTDFSDSDLSGAVIWGADARWAKFERTDLTDADFWLADVSGAIYEPKTNALPKISGMASADGLHELTYQQSSTGLIELRNEFDASGFERQARQVTHAIWRTKRVKGWEGNILERVESMISLVLFEFTSAYGMKPYRPLLILFLLIPLFSVAYTFVIFGGAGAASGPTAPPLP